MAVELGCRQNVSATTSTRLLSAIVAAPLTQRSPLVTTIVASFISLTPGTLTLDVQLDEPGGPMLYLLVLGFTDVHVARADVAQVERWVVAAVTPGVPTAGEPGRRTGSANGVLR